MQERSGGRSPGAAGTVTVPLRLRPRGGVAPICVAELLSSLRGRFQRVLFVDATGAWHTWLGHRRTPEPASRGKGLEAGIQSPVGLSADSGKLVRIGVAGTQLGGKLWLRQACPHTLAM